MVISHGIKRILSRTVKTRPTNLLEMNHLFLSQESIQKESSSTVTSIYGSILPLINVRSPSGKKDSARCVHQSSM